MSDFRWHIQLLRDRDHMIRFRICLGAKMMMDMDHSRKNGTFILLTKNDRGDQEGQGVPATTDRQDKMPRILPATAHAETSTNLVNQRMTPSRQRYEVSGFGG